MAASAQLAMQDLEGDIEKKGTQCLNEQKGAEHANLFNGDSHLVLRSDADDQLLLNIPFSCLTKIRGIKVQAPAGDQAPTRMRVWVNKPLLDFESVDDTAATQTWDLTPDQLTDGAEPLATKYVKFQNVHNLQFMFENEEGEYTALSRLQIFGSSASGMDVSGLKAAGAPGGM